MGKKYQVTTCHERRGYPGQYPQSRFIFVLMRGNDDATRQELALFCEDQSMFATDCQLIQRAEDLTEISKDFINPRSDEGRALSKSVVGFIEDKVQPRDAVKRLRQNNFTVTDPTLIATIDALFNQAEVLSAANNKDNQVDNQSQVDGPSKDTAATSTSISPRLR